jgi:hypothetical protein
MPSSVINAGDTIVEKDKNFFARETTILVGLLLNMAFCGEELMLKLDI